MARYEAGETLASIARSYDCSPPAISYIVSRSRARGVAPNAVGSKAPALPEPQLINSDGSEIANGEPAASFTVSAKAPRPELGSADRDEVGTGLTAPPVVVAAAGAANGQHDVPVGVSEEDDERAHSERDGAKSEDVHHARTSEPAEGTGRDRHVPGTLHLSQADRNQAHVASERRDDSSRKPIISDPPIAPDTVSDHRDRIRVENTGQGQNTGQGRVQPSANGAHADLVERSNNYAGGAFIDVALRQRVQADIAAFLAAFDAALNRDTSETRAELRQATDRLLRAGARTRIELERLEARTPLPARNNEKPSVSTWRQR